MQHTLKEVLEDAVVFNDGDWVESKDQDPDGDVRLVQLADVGDGYYVDKSSRFMTTARAKALRCTFLEPGDLLVARMPDPLGRCCAFPGDEKPCVTVVDVCVIRPCQKKVFPRWLMHCINSPITRHKISGYITGTTRQRISRGNLGKVTVPLPPLSEQRRIAEILDRAEALRAKRRAALALLDELTQSIFLDMFGDPVSNPKGWEWCKLKNVLELITYGLTVRPKYVADGIPLISGKEIRSGIVDYENAAKISQKDFDALSEKAKPTKHDLLFSKTGSIGHTAIIETDSPFALAQNVARLTFAPKLVNYIYALFYLRSGSIQALAKRSVRGNAVKDPQLGVMGDFPFALPPLQLQLEFAQRIDTL